MPKNPTITPRIFLRGVGAWVGRCQREGVTVYTGICAIATATNAEETFEIELLKSKKDAAIQTAAIRRSCIR